MTVWRRGANSPLPQVLARAVTPEGVVPGKSAISQVDTPEALMDLLVSAGLRNVQVQEAVLSLQLGTGMAWQYVLGTGMRELLSGLDAEAVERIRQRFTAAVDVDSVDISVLVGLGQNPIEEEDRVLP